jgi:plasmid stabilization system protein ParE
VVRYRIEITEPANREIEETENWIAADSSIAAEHWASGLFEALRSLDTMPARCPLAPEDKEHAEEIRQLIYGRYRVLFTIRPDRVVILHVRHGARLPLRVE